MTASLCSDVGAITKQQTSVSKQSNPSLHCLSKLMGLGSTWTPMQNCIRRLLGQAQVSDTLSPWWHMNGWGIHKIWQKNNEQIVKYLAKCMPGVGVLMRVKLCESDYRPKQWLALGKVGCLMSVQINSGQFGHVLQYYFCSLQNSIGENAVTFELSLKFKLTENLMRIVRQFWNVEHNLGFVMSSHPVVRRVSALYVVSGCLSTINISINN